MGKSRPGREKFVFLFWEISKSGNGEMGKSRHERIFLNIDVFFGNIDLFFEHFDMFCEFVWQFLWISAIVYDMFCDVLWMFMTCSLKCCEFLWHVLKCLCMTCFCDVPANFHDFKKSIWQNFALSMFNTVKKTAASMFPAVAVSSVRDSFDG